MVTLPAPFFAGGRFIYHLSVAFFIVLYLQGINNCLIGLLIRVLSDVKKIMVT
jgi:hypothetical protein